MRSIDKVLGDFGWVKNGVRINKRCLHAGVLPDHMIRECVGIDPFAEGEKRPGKISFGLSHAGYDARLGPEFKLFSSTRNPGCVIDPKAIDGGSFEAMTAREDDSGRWFLIPPNGYALGCTLETFSIPRDVLAICVGKSTLARAGVLINCTPLEPEWTGKVTLEIGNLSPLPIKLYEGEGVCQVVFFRLLSDCETSYREKSGKYQDQTGLTLPKVD